MSTSAECSEFAGQRFVEKPSFSQTCSLLSQYLKEKGSFGDLSLGMTCNAEVSGAFAASRQPATMNLFPCEVLNKDVAAPQGHKNLFPRQFSFSSSSSPVPKEDARKITESQSVKVEPKTAPLTIFYAGQVMVFNDLPADRAKEIMNLANKGSTKHFTGFTVDGNNVQRAYTPNLAKNQTETRSSILPSAKPVPNLGKSLAQEQIPAPATIACELPIARRASLHRFLEKRKDRITSKAPYQVDGPAEPPTKPPSGGQPSWLGLAAQSPQ